MWAGPSGLAPGGGGVILESWGKSNINSYIFIGHFWTCTTLYTDNTIQILQYININYYVFSTTTND